MEDEGILSRSKTHWKDLPQSKFPKALVHLLASQMSHAICHNGSPAQQYLIYEDGTKWWRLQVIHRCAFLGKIYFWMYSFDGSPIKKQYAPILGKNKNLEEYTCVMCQRWRKCNNMNSEINSKLQDLATRRQVAETQVGTKDKIYSNSIGARCNSIDKQRCRLKAS